MESLSHETLNGRKVTELYITMLRIDNSGRSVIYICDHNSQTVLVIITYNIPNERRYFSESYDISLLVIEFDFFHFYFLNMVISFDI